MYSLIIINCICFPTKSND